MNGIKDCAISCNGGKLLHEFYCTVVGIAATALSLIDSFVEAMRIVENKKQHPLEEKV